MFNIMYMFTDKTTYIIIPFIEMQLVDINNQSWTVIVN